MNITELETKYKELGAEIERLKQAESGGKPKDGQDYYCLDAELELNSHYWGNDDIDIKLWNASNVYLTEQEAINAREFKLAVVRINREIVSLNKLDGFVADWHNIALQQEKWYPVFDFNGGWVTTRCFFCKFNFTFIYGSENTIESVLKSHAEDFDIVKKCGVV